MSTRTLAIMALTAVALQARGVSFMSLSNDLFDGAIAYTPMIITGNEIPQEASVPLAFILPGYREEDNEFDFPDI